MPDTTVTKTGKAVDIEKLESLTKPDKADDAFDQPEPGATPAPSKTVGDWDEVILRNPANADAYFQRGAARLRAPGAEEAALADFTEAVKISSQSGRVDSILRVVINHGADLYNGTGAAEGHPRDYAGACAFYQDGLKAVRPAIKDNKELLEKMDASLQKAEAEPEAAKRAFILRAAIDFIRDKLKSPSTHQMLGD